MKRVAVVLATSGLLATSLGVGVMAQPALAADGGLSVSIASAGTKKVDVGWADPSTILTTAFDAYLVTLDNDAVTTPDTADRSRFVDDAAARTVRFEDLNANTTYYATVYAVDYTDTGFDIVPADGQAADTALGTKSGAYSPVSIRSSSATVLSGKPVTLSGTLEDNTGQPLDGGTVTISEDAYPQFGGAAEVTDTTDTSGTWTVTTDHPLTENTWFWAEYRDTDGVGGWTGRILVEVRKKLSVTVDPGLTVNQGATVKFSGSTKGNPDFLDDSAVTACLQRLESGKWSKLFCKPLEANGDYVLSFKPGANADGKYRVFSGMGQAYADSWSKTKSLTVN